MRWCDQLQDGVLPSRPPRPASSCPRTPLSAAGSSRGQGSDGDAEASRGRCAHNGGGCSARETKLVDHCDRQPRRDNPHKKDVSHASPNTADPPFLAGQMSIHPCCTHTQLASRPRAARSGSRRPRPAGPERRRVKRATAPPRSTWPREWIQGIRGGAGQVARRRAGWSPPALQALAPAVTRSFNYPSLPYPVGPVGLISAPSGGAVLGAWGPLGARLGPAPRTPPRRGQPRAHLLFAPIWLSAEFQSGGSTPPPSSSRGPGRAWPGLAQPATHSPSSSLWFHWPELNTSCVSTAGPPFTALLPTAPHPLSYLLVRLPLRQVHPLGCGIVRPAACGGLGLGRHRLERRDPQGPPSMA